VNVHPGTLAATAYSKCFFAACLGALLALQPLQVVIAAPLYRIVPLRTATFDEMSQDAYRYTAAIELNEAGHVTGYTYNQNGSNAWYYNGAANVDIGLKSRHTGPYDMNEAGQVLGYSRPSDGVNGFMASIAWFYNGATTLQLGLQDSEHYNGSYPSQAGKLNEAGQVIGISPRFDGNSIDKGQSAWFYDGATTTNIGLTGSDYTSNEGRKYSATYDLNEAGQAIGLSARYTSNDVWSRDENNSFWLYNGATTIEIGLADSEHSSSDGRRYSEPWYVDLNEAGQVTGTSYRYNGGSTFRGRSGWLYNGTTTINIGLTDSEHTSGYGERHSFPAVLNEAGQVRGYSFRYSPSGAHLGTSVWLYDGRNTMNVGLTGPEHTRIDGYKYSVGYGSRLNESGRVLGYANRYNGGSKDLGTSVWLYDGATTRDIGLTGSEHTRNDGYKASYGGQFNEAGQAVGYSSRFNGGNTDLGVSIWFFDGATTRDIGLNGTEHTRADGYKHGGVSDTELVEEFDYLNEAGQIIGVSFRYNGGNTKLGEDAWFYDPELNQTIALRLSMRSDGYAYSRADYLGEDGLILGTYTLFDEFDNDLGNRAFYFTMSDGMHDLESLVLSGVTNRLTHALHANGRGQILAYHNPMCQGCGQTAYLLTPVPEPSMIWLAALGSFGLIAWRKCAGLIFTPPVD
jgi:hypothetical protein